MANTGVGQPVSASGTLPFSIQDDHGAELLSLFHAPSHRTSSGAVRHGQQVRGSVMLRNRCLVAARVTISWCAKSRHRPFLLRCVRASSLLTDDQTGNDFAGATCKLWFWSNAPRFSSRRRGTRPAWPSLRELGLRGNVWTLMRSGYRTKTSKCAATRARATMASPVAGASGHPTAWAHGFPGRVCALCQNLERTVRGRCPGASGARARGTAFHCRLGGSAGHGMWSPLCTVRGSHGCRVVWAVSAQ